MVRYGGGEVSEREITDLAELPETAPGAGVTWIDIQGLGDEAVLRRVGDIFGLHPLILEDAVNIPQRAKSEVHGEHHVIVARVPVVEEHGRVGTRQVCFVLSKGCLITFQERYFGFFDPVRKRIREGIGPISQQGADYLAYALLDTLIDLYYPVVEQLSQDLADLEVRLAAEPSADVLGSIHAIRSCVAVIRRIGWPQREAVFELLRDPSPFVSDEVKPFLRDTYGHICQIIELVDSTREMAVALSEVYLSTMAHRTNEIMRLLTLMASIFIPLTFIAGIYGMNFDNMPELHSPRGYYGVLAAMILVAASMLGYFYHKGWIGRRG
jgi:magnesium transporter